MHHHDLERYSSARYRCDWSSSGYALWLRLYSEHQRFRQGWSHRRSGVVVPVLVQFLRYVRLYTDEPDICMSEFCLSDSGRKQSVEFSHRAGVECLATVLDCNKDSFFNLFADIFKYFPVTESAASFHYSLTISNQNIYPSTLYLVYLVRSTIIAD